MNTIAYYLLLSLALVPSLIAMEKPCETTSATSASWITHLSGQSQELLSELASFYKQIDVSCLNRDDLTVLFKGSESLFGQSEEVRVEAQRHLLEIPDQCQRIAADLEVALRDTTKTPHDQPVQLRNADDTSLKSTFDLIQVYRAGINSRLLTRYREDQQKVMQAAHERYHALYCSTYGEKPSKQNSLYADFYIPVGQKKKEFSLFCDGLDQDLLVFLKETYGEQYVTKMKGAYEVSLPNKDSLVLFTLTHHENELSLVTELGKRAWLTKRVLKALDLCTSDAPHRLMLQYYDAPLKRSFKPIVHGNETAFGSYTAGLTYATDHKMYLWRGREELLKLYTHELIHYYLALNVPDSSELAQLFALSDGHRFLDLDEARTKALANIINMLITAHELAQQEKWSQDQLNECIRQMWLLEKCFSLYQVAKILHLGSFTSWAEFTNRTSEKRMKDHGRTIEYFIMKALLLFDVSQLITSYAQGDKLTACVKATLKDSEFAGVIDALLTSIRKQDTASALFKTGRQTIIEKAHDCFKVD